MKKIISLTLSVVCISFFASAQKEYKLQYSFKKGDAYEWSQTAATKQHIAGPGFDQNIESNTNVNATMKVTELTATGARFEVEYTKLYTKSTQAVMDSDGDTAKNVPNKILQSMKGKKFNFTLLKNGTVESIDNIENLWSGISSIKGIPEGQGVQMKQAMENTFGKNPFKSSLEIGMVNYPDQKIKVGITWKSKTELVTPIPLATDNTWTLESIAEPTAVVTSDGIIATTDTTKVISPQPGLKATTNFKGRRVTKGTINVASGWPQSCKSYSEQKGTMLLQAGGQIPEDMQIQMEISTDSEYTIKKK